MTFKFSMTLLELKKTKKCHCVAICTYLYFTLGAYSPEKLIILGPWL